MCSNLFLICLKFFGCCSLFVAAQLNPIENDPTVYSWIKKSGSDFNNGISANIDKIEYSDNYAYIHFTGFPSYSIGSWNNSINKPIDQNVVFKLRRNKLLKPTRWPPESTPNQSLSCTMIPRAGSNTCPPLWWYFRCPHCRPLAIAPLAAIPLASSLAGWRRRLTPSRSVALVSSTGWGQSSFLPRRVVLTLPTQR